MSKILLRSIFPVTLVAAFVLHYFLLKTLTVPALSPLIILCGVGLLVTSLELVFPYRQAWKPNKWDVFSDALYMSLVQTVLPNALTFLVTAFILSRTSPFLSRWAPTWPHQWPLAGQVALMVLFSEFLQYWQHRFSHRWNSLWRFHAVHHSLKKIYWMNGAHFHPVDRTVQFMVDSLPFLLLGTSQEVLSYCFLLFGLKGFFQHCNVDVKYGILNYVFSGPELHRWHHSLDVKASNHNYGNTVIVWDLLFRTFYLPKGKSVGELGFERKDYPTGILSQMAVPFSKKAFP